MLVLTWIKGEPLPGNLVGDVLGALKLERETQEEIRRRSTAFVSVAAGNSERRRSAIDLRRQAESDDEDDSEVHMPREIGGACGGA